MGALAPTVGRWHIFVCEACGEPTGRHKDCENAKRTATEVVPVDEAAIERVAQHLYDSSDERVRVKGVSWVNQSDGYKGMWRDRAREAFAVAAMKSYS